MTNANPPVAQPPVLGGPCPYLSVSNAGKAADYYVAALGAKEVMLLGRQAEFLRRRSAARVGFDCLPSLN